MKKTISNKVLGAEIGSFVFILILIWLDEVIDIPHLLLGADATPLNWRESLFESVIILFLAIGIIWNNAGIFRRMRHLEGILPVCANCKGIRDEKGAWHPIESYIKSRSEAEFSHGLCPRCAEKLYPEFIPGSTERGKAPLD